MTVRRTFILLAAFVFAFGATIVGIVSWDWYAHDGTPNQVELETCQSELVEIDSVLDENAELWLEIIDLREEADSLRDKNAVRDEYCQCPWTPMPLLRMRGNP